MRQPALQANRVRKRDAGRLAYVLPMRDVLYGGGLMPQRIQRRRAKGWRMPDGAVYVGRGSEWGNPFVVGQDGTRDECLRLFVAVCGGFLAVSRPRETVEAQERLIRAVRGVAELAGKDLACWCRLDQACHADILLALANGQPVPAQWRPTLTRIG